MERRAERDMSSLSERESAVSLEVGRGEQKPGKRGVEI